MDFLALPVWINASLFVAVAAVVWIAGARLASYADEFSEITGYGHALIGMLLLGGITSLPEIAVALSAGYIGNAPLAVNNLLGGVALQVVILAIGDAVLRQRALTFVTASSAILLQGVFCCVLLCMVIFAIVMDDVLLSFAGAWSITIFAAAIVMLWIVSQHRETWPSETGEAGEFEDRTEAEAARSALNPLIVRIIVVALVILAAGYLLTRTGEALAEQTGLGSSFVGAIFVALATSLPEISTIYAIVRLKRYVMAFSDIFGTNIIDIALILLIDLTYGGPPVLNEMGDFSIFAAALGVVVTLIYLAGLIERKDRKIGRLGVDSWIVVLAYLGGVMVLYTLRG
jgi:cation:H+ antiporter